MVVVGLVLIEVGPNLVENAQFRTSSASIREISADFDPNAAEFGPTPAEIALYVIAFWHDSAGRLIDVHKSAGMTECRSWSP